MNNSLDDELGNRKIEINKIDPTPLSSNEKVPQQEKPLKINLVKNTYANFVKNIKNLATKKLHLNLNHNHNQDKLIFPLLKMSLKI